MIYFIADAHFGHSAIIKLCSRPFENADEMDMFMVDMWNSKVSRNDTVYIIGDLFYKHKNSESILSQLKGKKKLIIGNHDGGWMNTVDLSKYFVSVDSFAEVSDGKRNLVLCHYPLMSWKREQKSYMVHGHIHNNTDAAYWPIIKNNPRILNAGVEIIGFWPVSFDEMLINNECFKEGLRTGEVSLGLCD